MLRLPKDLADNPRKDVIEAWFTASEAPLRDGGAAKASHWQFDERIVAAIKRSCRPGTLVQGLEEIRKTLDRELKGLDELRKKTGREQQPRLSRLLVLANDGSDRFYRDVESLLARHGARTWACVVDASSEALGKALAAKGGPAKALMIADRKALAGFLAALAE